MSEDERGSGVGLALAIVAGVLVVLLVCGGGIFGLGFLRWQVASEQDQAVIQVEQAMEEAEAARRDADAARQAEEAARREMEKTQAEIEEAATRDLENRKPDNQQSYEETP